MFWLRNKKINFCYALNCFFPSTGETPEAFEMRTLNQNNCTDNNNLPMEADPMFSADNKSNLPSRTTDKDGRYKPISLME